MINTVGQSRARSGSVGIGRDWSGTVGHGRGPLWGGAYPSIKDLISMSQSNSFPVLDRKL